jgi:redox-sensitive bicupin YhaK (pirin superfamily)
MTIDRKLTKIITGNNVTDGDGVQLTRIIGTHELPILDPFLMFDAFGTDRPQDYIGGFPDHPHRGFETVTYLLAGRLRHKDSEGNHGVIEAGGVQWMTAGSGVVHSEMPEQEQGLLQGFQLWVNLPAKFKMTKPDYQEFTAAQITQESINDQGVIRVITGKTNKGTIGPVINGYVSPTYLDVSLERGQNVKQSVSVDDNAFIYVIEGTLSLTKGGPVLTAGQLGILEEGDSISVTADESARFLLAAARPLNEPVVRGGPFVMNTREQLEQAFADFGR